MQSSRRKNSRRRHWRHTRCDARKGSGSRGAAAVHMGETNTTGDKMVMVNTDAADKKRNAQGICIAGRQLG
jgi:hypothetical protein